LNSLTLLLAFLSGDSDQSELTQLLPIERAPFSLLELESAARAQGFETELARWRWPKEAALTCPAILHVRGKDSSTAPDHFLASFGETADGLCVAEFPKKPFILPRRRLEQIWRGDVLYIDRPGRTPITELRRGALLDTACLVFGLGSVIFLSSTVIYRSWHGRRIARSRQPRA
jgi:ABC-type bacteriocin/lantibiotic exporter with double-glycine peptidase domain